MCEFCDSLKDKNKQITWQLRSTYADNNICEFVNDTTCSLCNGCQMGFSLKVFNYEGNAYVGVEYKQVIKSRGGEEVVIWPFSESIQFNFCPVCGDQLSKKLKHWREYFHHQICVEDRE